MVQNGLSFVGLLLIFANKFMSVEVAMTPGEQCNRPCRAGDNKNCYYKMVMENFRNGVMSINGVVPGYPINVCKGDRITVDVVNMAQGPPAAVYWQGQRISDISYTIVFRSTYRYDFWATQAGFYCYHAHYGYQYGQYGALNIRDPKELVQNINLYDFDLPEHYALITGYGYDFAQQSFGGLSNGISTSVSLLINGKGILFDLVNKKPAIDLPVTRYSVQRGRRYRFRILGALTGVPCDVSFRFSRNPMVIISRNSIVVEPRVVDSLVIRRNETYDIVYQNNNEAIDMIIVQGLERCPVYLDQAYAILQNAIRV